MTGRCWNKGHPFLLCTVLNCTRRKPAAGRCRKLAHPTLAPHALVDRCRRVEDTGEQRGGAMERRTRQKPPAPVIESAARSRDCGWARGALAEKATLDPSSTHNNTVLYCKYQYRPASAALSWGGFFLLLSPSSCPSCPLATLHYTTLGPPQQQHI